MGEGAPTLTPGLCEDGASKHPNTPKGHLPVSVSPVRADVHTQHSCTALCSSTQSRLFHYSVFLFAEKVTQEQPHRCKPPSPVRPRPLGSQRVLMFPAHSPSCTGKRQLLGRAHQPRSMEATPGCASRWTSSLAPNASAYLKSCPRLKSRTDGAGLFGISGLHGVLLVSVTAPVSQTRTVRSPRAERGVHASRDRVPRPVSTTFAAPAASASLPTRCPGPHSPPRTHRRRPSAVTPPKGVG